MPTILAGVNQAILLALSMSVVTSMIGVKGLGGMVLQGLGQLNVGLASVGGLSIVLIAVMLDRMTNVFGTSNSQISWKERGPIGLFSTGSKVQKIAFGAFGATIILVLLVASITGQQTQEVATSSTGESLPGKGVNVQSVHSSLLEERFQTEIVNIGLRKLGYKTSEPKQIEPTTFHLALGQGDLDYTAAHWETGHQSFFEKAGGEQKLERLGVLTPNLLHGFKSIKKLPINIILPTLNNSKIQKLPNFLTQMEMVKPT